MEAYIFRARCYNVVDGDTIDCTVDVGFGMSTTQRFRLWGVNCPEKRSPVTETRMKAYQAMEFTASLIFNEDIMIQTYKDDVFGRYLAKVFIPEDDTVDVIGEKTYTCLNDLLILEGLAVPFMRDTELLSK